VCASFCQFPCQLPVPSCQSGRMICKFACALRSPSADLAAN
jgi:hypothetical protein